MATKGTVTVRIVGDSKDLEAALSRSSGAVDKFGDSTSRAGDRLANAGTKLSTFASIPIAAAMGAAAKSASDLEQSAGAVESVFGDAAGSIEEFGETAASTVGLSKRQVNEMAAVIGASLQGVGFSAEEAADQVVTLEGRAADLAATFGGDTQTAIDAIGAALRGERDSIEKYGVSIKDADVQARILALGLDTGTVAADKKATAIATLDLVMGQTAKTEGQFAREADGAAGSLAVAKAEMENVAAELGESLLPIIADVAGGVADVAGAFASLPDGAQTAILALAGIAVVSGPILTVVGNLQKARAGMAAFQASSLAGGAALGAFKGGAIAAVAGLVALQAVESFEKSKIQVAGIEALTGALLDYGEAGVLTSDLLSITGDNFEDLGHKIEIAGNSPFSVFDSAGRAEVNEANAQIDALDKTLSSLFAQDPQAARAMFDTITDAAGRQGVSIETVRDRFDDYSETVAGAGNAARIAADDTDAVTEAAGEATPTLEELAAAAERSDEKFSDLSDAITGVGDALYGAIDAQFAYLESEDQIQDALAEQVAAQKDYNDTVKTFGVNSGEAAASREQLERADRNLAKAQLESVKAAEDLNTALANEYITIAGNEQATGAFRDKLAGLQTQFPELAGVIQPYIDRLNAIPRDVVTRLSIRDDGVLGFSGSNIQARAEGGPVSASTPYLVGEEGPEIVVPRSGGTVIPNDRIAGGGNTTEVTINLSGADMGLASQVELLTRAVSSAMSASGR